MSDIEIEQILEDFLARSEAGKDFDEAQCLHDHPHLADELKDFFRLHREAHQAFAFPSIGTAHASPQFLPTLSHDPSSAAKPPTSTASAWSWSRIAEAQFPMRFGAYDLLEEINRGGMGIVYRAVQRELGRTVALKVLRAGEMATDEEVRRFRTEVLASTALSHPNIIPTFEAGQLHGLFYLTMAYIEGEDLQSKLRDLKTDPQRAAKLLLKITEAVSHAHHHNIIHRDIKPSNILVDQCGEPFLADFGLAHRMREDDGLTATGQILGTPAYMPPEQASGRARKLTTSVDVYSLGAVLYAMLTGQPPFSGPTPFDVLLQVVDRQPPAPRQLNRVCPKPLELICLKAMGKQPEDRYQSADELACDLRRFMRGEVIEFPKPTLYQRALTWWRREPILVSHVCALLSVIVIVLISYLCGDGANSPDRFAIKLPLLITWVVACVALQRLSRVYQYRAWVHLAWAASDIVIYTALMFVADKPRGLLMVGYPMMIAASGLFYRVRFVVFMTITCNLAMLLLVNFVDDPITQRIDFLAIYFIGITVLGLCVMTMIRRIRGLSRFCGASE